MPRLGAHLSIAGGLPRAVDRAEASRCEALQIFTKSAGQWRARPLPPEEIALFRRRVRETAIHPVVAHNSYLINLAAADAALRAQSLAALGEELERADVLGLDGLVMHPGSYTTGSEEGGLRLIADGLRTLLRSRRRMRVRILLEHTAGQGTNLGRRFEHLRTILDHLGGTDRVGVCLDTCHLLAAGYDLCTPEGYARTFRDFDRIVGPPGPGVLRVLLAFRRSMARSRHLSGRRREDPEPRAIARHIHSVVPGRLPRGADPEIVAAGRDHEEDVA